VFRFVEIVLFRIFFQISISTAVLSSSENQVSKVCSAVSVVFIVLAACFKWLLQPMPFYCYYFKWMNDYLNINMMHLCHIYHTLHFSASCLTLLIPTQCSKNACFLSIRLPSSVYRERNVMYFTVTCICRSLDHEVSTHSYNTSLIRLFPCGSHGACRFKCLIKFLLNDCSSSSAKTTMSALNGVVIIM